MISLGMNMSPFGFVSKGMWQVASLWGAACTFVDTPIRRQARKLLWCLRQKPQHLGGYA